jgi:hypothetical protein
MFVRYLPNALVLFVLVRMALAACAACLSMLRHGSILMGWCATVIQCIYWCWPLQSYYTGRMVFHLMH